MPWYSGFLPYYNEVTKNEYETNWLRVGFLDNM